MEEALSLNFRLFTVKFSGVRKFRNFKVTYLLQIHYHREEVTPPILSAP